MSLGFVGVLLGEDMQFGVYMLEATEQLCNMFDECCGDASIDFKLLPVFN